MPVLSVVILCVLLYVILRKNTYTNRYTDLFVLSCTLKIYWFQGYFFKIGSNEITSIANIAGYSLLLYSIYLVVSKKIRIESYTCKTVILFIFVICVGMIYEKVFPYDGLLMPEQNEQISWDGYIAGTCSMYHYVPSFSACLRRLWEVISFSFEILVFKQICSFSWIINPYMKIIGYLKYGIYYGYLEFVLKNIIGNLTVTFDFAAILLGVNEQSVFTEAQIRDGIFYTLQGLTREPSHFNCFLFNLMILMLLGNVIKRMAKKSGIDVRHTYNNRTLCACLGLMLLTGGFSSVWFLFVVGCCVLVLNIREFGSSILDFFCAKKWIVLLFLILCIMIVFAIAQNDYLYTRLSDAIAVVGFLSASNGFTGISILGDGGGIGSTIARFVSIYEGTMIFIDRPLLGVSYGVQPLHDFSMMLLSNMGLLGCFFLYKMLISSKEKIQYDFVLIFLIFIIGGFPITISPYGLNLYWVLIFEATTFYMNSRENDDGSYTFGIRKGK